MINIIKISDPNLRSKIEIELDKPAGADINEDEMADLKELNVIEASVSDLRGLEYAKNLSH